MEGAESLPKMPKGPPGIATNLLKKPEFDTDGHGSESRTPTDCTNTAQRSPQRSEDSESEYSGYGMSSTFTENDDASSHTLSNHSSEGGMLADGQADSSDDDLMSPQDILTRCEELRAMAIPLNPAFANWGQLMRLSRSAQRINQRQWAQALAHLKALESTETHCSRPPCMKNATAFAEFLQSVPFDMTDHVLKTLDAHMSTWEDTANDPHAGQRGGKREPDEDPEDWEVIAELQNRVGERDRTIRELTAELLETKRGLEMVQKMGLEQSQGKVQETSLPQDDKVLWQYGSNHRWGSDEPRSQIPKPKASIGESAHGSTTRDMNKPDTSNSSSSTGTSSPAGSSHGLASPSGTPAWVAQLTSRTSDSGNEAVVNWQEKAQEERHRAEQQQQLLEDQEKQLEDLKTELQECRCAMQDMEDHLRERPSTVEARRRSSQFFGNMNCGILFSELSGLDSIPDSPASPVSSPFTTEQQERRKSIRRQSIRRQSWLGELRGLKTIPDSSAGPSLDSDPKHDRDEQRRPLESPIPLPLTTEQQERRQSVRRQSVRRQSRLGELRGLKTIPYSSAGPSLDSNPKHDRDEQHRPLKPPPPPPLTTEQHQGAAPPSMKERRQSVWRHSQLMAEEKLSLRPQSPFFKDLHRAPSPVLEEERGTMGFTDPVWEEKQVRLRPTAAVSGEKPETLPSSPTGVHEKPGPARSLAAMMKEEPGMARAPSSATTKQPAAPRSTSTKADEKPEARSPTTGGEKSEIARPLSLVTTELPGTSSPPSTSAMAGEPQGMEHPSSTVESEKPEMARLPSPTTNEQPAAVSPSLLTMNEQPETRGSASLFIKELRQEPRSLGSIIWEQLWAWVEIWLWLHALVLSPLPGLTRSLSSVSFLAHIDWDSWKPTSVPPRPLPTEALGRVLRQAVVFLSMQTYISCHQQRKIWLDANTLTRTYLVKQFREGTTWWWLPGVDPELMTWGKTFRPSFIMLVQTADVWAPFAVARLRKMKVE